MEPYDLDCGHTVCDNCATEAEVQSGVCRECASGDKLTRDLAPDGQWELAPRGTLDALRKCALALLVVAGYKHADPIRVQTIVIAGAAAEEAHTILDAAKEKP